MRILNDSEMRWGEGIFGSTDLKRNEGKKIRDQVLLMKQRVLLGVSGSVAAIKVPLLVERLQREVGGWE